MPFQGTSDGRRRRSFATYPAACYESDTGQRDGSSSYSTLANAYNFLLMAGLGRTYDDRSRAIQCRYPQDQMCVDIATCAPSEAPSMTQGGSFLDLQGLQGLLGFDESGRLKAMPDNKRDSGGNIYTVGISNLHGADGQRDVHS